MRRAFGPRDPRYRVLAPPALAGWFRYHEPHLLWQQVTWMDAPVIKNVTDARMSG